MSGAAQNRSLLLLTMMLSLWLDFLLVRWNAEDKELATESFRHQFFRYVDRVLISVVSPYFIISQLLSDSRMARS